MEATEVIIARLVLGYLKEEKCRTAYKEFLKTSHHLKCDLSRSKYLPTRFVGLTLEDILTEYFEISKIVQGRLEATNYYNEHHSRKSLVQQLLYLLNRSRSQSSRTSTPCPRSPLESHLDESSPSHIDHISDVETTPAYTLPGNVHCTSEDSVYRSPKRKSNSKQNKSATESTLEVAEKEDMSEVLAHTLLENKEFHEKIAQTINKVAEKQYRHSSELDKTVKTVVEETEADPIFDKILEEIIGSATENFKGVDTCSTTSSSAKDKVEEGRCKSKNYLNSDESLDQNFTHADTQTVDQQNDEAVRSIVTNSKQKVNSSRGNDQEVQVNNEVTVFNGSLDKYLMSNACTVNSQVHYTPPVYIDNNIIVVPSNIASNGSLQIGSANSKFVVNKAVNWNLPSVIPNACIPERQDILTMPTIIVTDAKQNNTVTGQQPLKTPNSKTRKRSSNVPLIPKPIIEIAPEYLNSIKRNDNQPQKGLKNVIYPKTSKKETTEKTAETNCQTTTNTRNKIHSSDAKKSLPDDLLQVDTEPLTEDDDVVLIDTETVSAPLTPPPAVERVDKTPKSGSHVRSLTFSTPNSAFKKSCKNTFPTSTRKKQAAKSLFHSQTPTISANEKTTENSKVSKKQEQNCENFKIWDADLRAAILPKVEDDEIKENVTKKRKQSSVKSVKKKGKKCAKLKRQLNTTEHDAAAIEAALQTPIKSNNEELEKSDHRDEIKMENHNTDDDRLKEKNCNTEENNAKDSMSKNTDKSSEGLVNEPNEPNVNKNKTVLSPSKLNANKRKLISGNDINNDVNASVKPVDETIEFETPEMAKDNFHYPIKANRNITSMFETPIKNDCLPKTPGAGSPSMSLNTPLSELLRANLNVMDDNYCIPTPNIPITPNFPPITPNVEGLTSYSNRPTDYSSSSYYHPSDNEQNRSVEANIFELETQPFNDPSGGATESKENIPDSTETKNDTVKPVNPIDERLKIFNGNIIGKKNLSLVKRNISADSNSSSNSSSESSSEEETVSPCNSIEKNTEIKKCSDTPKRIYSLRNRASTNKKETASEVKEITTNKQQSSKGKKTNVKQTNLTHKNVTAESQENETPSQEFQKEIEITVKEEMNTAENITLQQAELKKELKEKLIRTVNKIKNVEKRTAKKSGQFMKIKLLPNMTKNKRKTKSENVKKTVQKATVKKKGDANSENNISSRKNKNCEKFSPTQTRNDSEKNDKSASDIEAQNLIEGLKERGILLMKNKPSPVKKVNEKSNLLESNNSCNNKNDTSENDIQKTYVKENPLEVSSSELERDLRETYDTTTIAGEYEWVVHSESKKNTKNVKTIDVKVLEKSFVGKVYIEEINKEIDIPMVFTPFYALLDIPPNKNLSQKQNLTSHKVKSNKKSEEKTVNKDIVGKAAKNDTNQQRNPAFDNDHAVSKILKEDKDESEISSVKKRKIDKEDCRVPEEKQCKSLLQQINVETFLNNLYGKN